MSSGRLGRYTLLSEPRAGQRTAVYRARLGGLPRELALKTLSPRATTEEARAEARRALQREAELRAALDHPAILPLYDLARARGEPLLVGPWLSGGTVWERWRERPPPREVLGLAEHIGAGLDALHARGWIHGDISPNNLLFDADGRARIVDLGSCVRLGSRRALRVGEPGALRWGVTRLTAAPECWTGEPVEGRADLYALAALLYWGLCGAWPFAEDEPAASRGSPPPPSLHLPALGPRVDAAMMAALDPASQLRPASGEALAATLREALGEAGRPAFWLRRAAAPAAELPRERARRAEEALQRHLGALPASEREELLAARELIRLQDVRERAEASAAVRALVAPVAVWQAAESLGVLRALGEASASAGELAARLGLDEDRLARMLRFLAADGRVRRVGERWSLARPLGALYRDSLDLLAPRAPLGDQLTRWAALPAWARGDAPPLAMDADRSGGAYAGPVDDLGDNAARMAEGLAGALDRGDRAPDRAEILDIGVGSAVWSLALAARWPEATVTALDRPAVLEVARARAAAEGLAGRLRTLEGSWQERPLPEGRFGLVVLARLCHLCSPAQLDALIARAGAALSPDGRLLILDTVPESMDEAEVCALRYDLALGLRTASGRVHDLRAYESAFSAAGLRLRERWPVVRGGAGMDALLVGRA